MVMRPTTLHQLRIADCGLRIFRSQSQAIRYCINPKSEIRNPKSSRGLTLIEVIASTLIVGLMAVATLNGLASATKSANSIGNRAVAAGLADELMSEIVMQSYSDPDGAAVFGRETGESASPRSQFDDVDDYNGWNASPPQYRDGTVIPDRTNWRQRVTVTRATPANPTVSSATEQGAKQIRVTIEFQNVTIADQITIRHDDEAK